MIRPERAEQTERDRDEEHQPPVDRSEQAAEDQADERPGNGRHLVDTEGESASVGRERVGEDSRRIREQHGRANALDDAPEDDPQRARAMAERVDGQRDRADREDHEAEVVDTYAAVDVSEPAERHDQYRRHQQEAHQHPEQVADVSRGQRVEIEPAEDVRQGDDHDRGVDGGDQHAECRVRQDDPLVVRMIPVEAQPRCEGACAQRHSCSLA